LAKFLRAVKQGRWAKYPDVPWLAPTELKGDALRDLGTTDGVISVYEVADDDLETRIAVALAATRQKPAVFDYIVFEDTGLAELGVTISSTPSHGGTPDSIVNDLHHDVQGFTSEKLNKFAQAISGSRMERLLGPKVRSLLTKALRDGELDQQVRSMADSLLEKLDF
jgi:hypothetical protein